MTNGTNATEAVNATAAHQRAPTPQRPIRLPRSTKPARPRCQPVTIPAATAGPTRPGSCVGHPRPGPTRPPVVHTGSHHAHDNAYVNTTNHTTGHTLAARPHR